MMGCQTPVTEPCWRRGSVVDPSSAAVGEVLLAVMVELSDVLADLVDVMLKFTEALVLIVAPRCAGIVVVDPASDGVP